MHHSRVMFNMFYIGLASLAVFIIQHTQIDRMKLNCPCGRAVLYVLSDQGVTGSSPRNGFYFLRVKCLFCNYQIQKLNGHFNILENIKPIPFSLLWNTYINFPFLKFQNYKNGQNNTLIVSVKRVFCLKLGDIHIHKLD